MKIAQVTLAADVIDGVEVFPFVKDGVYTPGEQVCVNSDGVLAPIADSDEATEAVASIVAFDAQKGELTLFVNAHK